MNEKVEVCDVCHTGERIVYGGGDNGGGCGRPGGLGLEVGIDVHEWERGGEMVRPLMTK